MKGSKTNVFDSYILFVFINVYLLKHLKNSIWISRPQIVPYQIRQIVFNSKSTLTAVSFFRTIVKKCVLSLDFAFFFV